MSLVMARGSQPIASTGAPSQGRDSAGGAALYRPAIGSRNAIPQPLADAIRLAS